MALGVPSRMPSATEHLGQLLERGERSFSFEFFPPKDAEGERVLWQSIRELEPLKPSFVSVTYGAGGSTRERTAAITGRIARETTLTPMAHLTCVGHTVDELRSIIGGHLAAGVRNIMALRGDPPEGPRAPWVPTPGGFEHAVDLVRLARSLGDFGIGVAAFPEKNPASASLALDAEILAAKAAAGADFAVTQLFFSPEPYFELVERVRSLGCAIPIIPGIMPVLNLRSVARMAELSGAEIPAGLVARVSRFQDDPAAVRAEGIAVATELCDALLAGGAPGLHFYTLNRSRATREIFGALACHA
ncbi:MAG TPA: methylenetetrahydrofolate reductase [NAD(P)H] [Marmoricola sp.]|nr:methylenetetrahydrofolate reductase [NAD(P)H] [Marmoricola sp.]